mmetsp:Transcript_26644/g.63296  ORF Transcript_26644/g.63296 Transcript_26644/m.63296 type:complete len:220 (-) Transcript_26644:144-803(-)
MGHQDRGMPADALRPGAPSRDRVQHRRRRCRGAECGPEHACVVYLRAALPVLGPCIPFFNARALRGLCRGCARDPPPPPLHRALPVPGRRFTQQRQPRARLQEARPGRLGAAPFPRAARHRVPFPLQVERRQRQDQELQGHGRGRRGSLAAGHQDGTLFRPPSGRPRRRRRHGPRRAISQEETQEKKRRGFSRRNGGRSASRGAATWSQRQSLDVPRVG